MDALHLILIVVTLLLLAAVGWLLYTRAELLSRAVAADAARATADTRIVALDARERELNDAMTAAQDRLNDLIGELAAQSARLERVEAERQADRINLEQSHARHVKEIESRAVAERTSLCTQHARELTHLNASFNAKIESERAILTSEKANVEAMLKEHRQTVERVKEQFASLSAEHLKSSSQQFLTLATERLGAMSEQSKAELEKRQRAVESLVTPIAESLKRADQKLTEMERQRADSFVEIRTQMDALNRGGADLRAETARLVNALRAPKVRGRYGEVQLRRVAELAGMRSYCDFVEQNHAVDSSGNAKRPDMIVKLPVGRELVVDAKANLLPYLDAIEATDPDIVDAHLQRFADGVASQAGKLGEKNYYADYAGSPDFVVMFMPGDQFVDAALSKRPDLLDIAASKNVIIASPSSLIAILRAVAVGFREANLAEQAEELFELGRELHERAAVAMEHIAKLGRNLEGVLTSYNAFVGSYESRLAPTLSRFEQAQVKSVKALPPVVQIETRPRALPIQGLLLPEP
ncbi:MAG: DNA recombination protein RmuC [Phycisphaerales bacterium]|nr:DNA recombination protein RmuC [Phycisphaerales bacterium]